MIFYYVCDKCGNLVTITDAAIPEGEEWECDICHGSALWEFTDKQKALSHAEHIQHALALLAWSGGIRSGIFRSAR